MESREFYDDLEEFDTLVRTWVRGRKDEAAREAEMLRQRLSTLSDPYVEHWLIPRLNAFLTVCHETLDLRRYREMTRDCSPRVDRG